MKNISRLLVAALLVVVMAAPIGAEPLGSDQGPVVVTLAGAQFHSYTAPVVVVQKGGELTYANLDIVQHDLVQDPRADGFGGPKKAPWCAAFRRSMCPAFWTPKIGLGQQTEVLGLENVKPGATYTFYCTLHASMKGILVVAP